MELNLGGALAGFLVFMYGVGDPLLNALGRSKVPRRLGEPILYMVAAVLPGAVTVAAALIFAGVMR